MSAASLFDWVAEALERHSFLTRLEARGALRLTLQKMGLDPKTLTEAQVVDLLRGPLASDLHGRAVKDAAAIGKRLLGEFEAAHPRATRSAAAPVAVPADAVAPGTLPTLFDWAAEALEKASTLNRLNARGTLRLLLKDAGFPPEMVTKDQLAAAIAQLMPKHLQNRGVPEAQTVCSRILQELPGAAVATTEGQETPGDVFLRLGRT